MGFGFKCYFLLLCNKQNKQISIDIVIIVVFILVYILQAEKEKEERLFNFNGWIIMTEVLLLVILFVLLSPRK